LWDMMSYILVYRYVSWRLCSCGIWCLINWYIGHKISEELAPPHWR